MSNLFARRDIVVALTGLLAAAAACKPGTSTGCARVAAQGRLPAASAAETERLFRDAYAGKRIDLGGLNYAIDQPLVIGGGGMLNGPGRLSLAAEFQGQWAIEFAAGSGSGVRGVEVDGAAARAHVISGIRANGSTTGLTVQNCIISNLSFDGIDISGGAGAYRHLGPAIEGNVIRNVGWVGINLESSTEGRLANNVIDRTGYHGLSAMLGCKGTQITGNHVTKATSPDRIFNGTGSLGGVEGGFMIAFDPSSDETLIEHNVCDDNRRAGYDGIGVSEDGTPFGRSRIIGNIVRRAGLFGIDAPGNCLVENNLVEEAAQQGIHIGLDLGGQIENVVVRNNIIRNTGTAHPGVDSFGILVGDTLGPAVRIRNVAIIGNTVLDNRPSPGTNYGIGVVSDEARYEDLSIEGNTLIQVKTASLLWIGRAGPGRDFKALGNRCRVRCSGPRGELLP